MKKIQIEKTIKKFNEFTEEEQEEILKNYRDINIDLDNWNDYILSDFIDEVKEKTDLDIETKDIIWEVGSRYSKFGVYSKNVINQLLHKFKNKGIYNINTTEKFGSFLNHRGGGICSKHNTELGITEVYFEDDKQKYTKKNKVVIEQINNIIDEVIELCSKYHNKNEEAYNYNISDEAIKDTLEANDYEFDNETRRIY